MEEALFCALVLCRAAPVEDALRLLLPTLHLKLPGAALPTTSVPGKTTRITPLITVNPLVQVSLPLGCA
jgi:hypothetical protein